MAFQWSHVTRGWTIHWNPNWYAWMIMKLNPLYIWKIYTYQQMTKEWNHVFILSFSMKMIKTSTIYQNINHETNRPLLNICDPLSISNEKITRVHCHFFSWIMCTHQRKNNYLRAGSMPFVQITLHRLYSLPSWILCTTVRIVDLALDHALYIKAFDYLRPSLH